MDKRVIINFPTVEYADINRELTQSIANAIQKAKDDGVTYGDLVATLQGYTTMITMEMLGYKDED
jgi:hypothetical protein